MGIGVPIVHPEPRNANPQTILLVRGTVLRAFLGADMPLLISVQTSEWKKTRPFKQQDLRVAALRGPVYRLLTHPWSRSWISSATCRAAIVLPSAFDRKPHVTQGPRVQLPAASQTRPVQFLYPSALDLPIARSDAVSTKMPATTAQIDLGLGPNCCFSEQDDKGNTHHRQFAPPPKAIAHTRSDDGFRHTHESGAVPPGVKRITRQRPSTKLCPRNHGNIAPAATCLSGRDPDAATFRFPESRLSMQSASSVISWSFKCVHSVRPVQRTSANWLSTRP